MKKMLDCLVHGDIPQEDFFERVWGLEASKEEHIAHIRANLSKLRKYLPKNSVILKNCIIRLV